MKNIFKHVEDNQDFYILGAILAIVLAVVASPVLIVKMIVNAATKR